jgi:pyruvate dehydrogenase E2 component (dihydrolipoamide acetyltransferase)
MAETVTMPKLGFDMAEGTLVRWVIAEGEKVTKGAVLAEIETDKATVEVESSYEGIVLRHLVPQGEVVPVNTPIAIVGAEGEAVSMPEVASADVKPATSQIETVPVKQPAIEMPTEAGLIGIVRASPLARRMAADRGIDLRSVGGTGPGGRITKKDIEAYVSKAPAVAIPVPAAQSSVPSPMLAEPAHVDRYVPLTRLRAAIGRRMVEATQQVPHFYVTHEYDTAAVMNLRKQVNALLREDEKVSVNDFIVKAASLALREFPNLNASLNARGDEIIRHGEVNVGVAVAVENGLLTVVSRDTDHKPLRQIALEVREMVNRVREGKVRPEDIEGSTFTVSNLGMFDVDQFTAIINPPEAAILAVGSVRQVPVIANGNVVPGLRMKATLSVDHRVSDGAEGAKFLQTLGKYLEEPLRLML